MSVQVTIMGNATADCDVRFTKDGKGVASFTVAVNEKVKDSQGNWTDGEPNFYRVSAWGSLTEGVSNQIVKGTRVVVVGMLKPKTYEYASGSPRMSLDIRAIEVGVSTGFTKVNQTGHVPEQDNQPAPF